jgi:hypothetical protein
MNPQIFVGTSSQQHTFWGPASKYASSVTNDEKFVSEIAYMMVTLHRTGA